MLFKLAFLALIGIALGQGVADPRCLPIVQGVTIRLPHETECNRYYVCHLGERFLMPACPVGWEFSADTLACAASPVQCFTPSSTIAPDTTTVTDTTTIAGDTTVSVDDTTTVTETTIAEDTTTEAMSTASVEIPTASMQIPTAAPGRRH